MGKKNDIISSLHQPIDLRQKCVKGFWGKKKIVATSVTEQKHLKKMILKIFPDNLFYDDLHEANSVEQKQGYSTNVLNKPINLRYKYKKTLFGKRIQVETSIAEQQQLKKAFLKVFPDCLFYDNMGDSNSVQSQHNNCHELDSKKKKQVEKKTTYVDVLRMQLEYELAMEMLEKLDDDCDCQCHNHDDHDDHGRDQDDYDDRDDHDCDCDDHDCNCDDHDCDYDDHDS